MGRRVTSADVAREAGLSRATVSYVLNDVPTRSISEATRRRVLAAAERLGYAPYAPARLLRRGRSDVVLLMLPDRPQGPVGHTLVERMAAELAAGGLTLVSHLAAGDEPLWQAIAPVAVVGTMLFTPEQTADMRRAGVELVVPSDAQADAIRGGGRSWSSRIGYVQAAHLLDQGHQRLACALPDEPRLADVARQRAAGARAACRALGMADPVVAAVPLDPVAAGPVVAGLLGEATAVCAFNDEVALALLAGARAVGARVPADLAVIGADDIPAARLVSPALTTVALDAGEIGRRVGAYVVAALAGERTGVPPDVGMLHVVRRESA